MKCRLHKNINVVEEKLNLMVSWKTSFRDAVQSLQYLGRVALMRWCTCNFVPTWQKKRNLVCMCMFKCLKVPVREIIPVFWFVGWQSGCEESQLILSHFGKMLTWNESCERQIYMAEMCVWVSLKERWGVRLSHFTDTLRDPRGRNRWKERDRACGRAAIRMRLKKVNERMSVCLLTSCSGESCSMSARRHLRPGRKWFTITSSEMTAQEVKDWNEKFIQKSLQASWIRFTSRTVGITMPTRHYLGSSAGSRSQMWVLILSYNDLGIKILKIHGKTNLFWTEQSA